MEKRWFIKYIGNHWVGCSHTTPMHACSMLQVVLAPVPVMTKFREYYLVLESAKFD